MQHEKKIFYPAPLSSLNKLSLSLLKPNGALFNNSMDNFNILKLEYDGAKPNYLKITTDIYFDKNEFFIGDFILIKSYLKLKTYNKKTMIPIKFKSYVPDFDRVLIVPKKCIASDQIKSRKGFAIF
jgi:hypothetical protein